MHLGSIRDPEDGLEPWTQTHGASASSVEASHYVGSCGCGPPTNALGADEPRATRPFGARADVTQSAYVRRLEAQLVVEHCQRARLKHKLQGRGAGLSVGVVISILRDSRVAASQRRW
jgi:hypothetical protein